MKDFKIKVDKNNAGEAIDLLVNLGHKLLSTKRGLICEVEQGSTHIVNDGNGIFTTKNYYGVKEITLQELRDMVNQEQDEPFLTPETTLNDQYAEIEQVRQQTIEATLAERQAQYGSFVGVANTTGALMAVIKNSKNGSTLPYAHEEALHMICSKIARIVNGDHNHKDSWHDIGGYSKLIEDLL